MRALALAVLFAAGSAEAAPWSVELPDGYTEELGATDADLVALRARPETVTADAQMYISADRQVGLMRVTVRSMFDEPLSRELLTAMDRDARPTISEDAATHISDDRQWAGDQLVGDTIEEIRGKRVHQRRLYAVDTGRIVYMLAVTCMGDAGRLAECEQAQQTMQLTLPASAKLPSKSRKSSSTNHRNIIGGAAVFALLLGLIIWVTQSARRGGRRRQRSLARRRHDE